MAALSGPNEFAEFYSRLKTIKDFHKKHPNEISVPMSTEFDELAKVRIRVELGLFLFPVFSSSGASL